MFLLVSLLALGQMAEKSDAPPPQEIPQTARQVLVPTCLVFQGPDKSPLARIWLLPSWVANAEPEQVANGLTLAELETGQTLGWLEVIKPLKDFRAREIPAGIYGLRLVAQPSSDDHNDTAPGPHFAMLIPAGDPDWKATKSLEDVFKLGIRVVDKHPAVLLLHPGGKTLEKGTPVDPKILSLESGLKALVWPQKIQTATLAAMLEIRLVLVGHSIAVKAP